MQRQEGTRVQGEEGAQQQEDTRAIGCKGKGDKVGGFKGEAQRCKSKKVGG